MIKYLFGIVLLLCISCGNKEDILLPKADRTVVKDVVDLSPIYIFFRIKGKDTLAEVNRKNSIGTTNWVLNIDKRLPLRLVIPEVMKMQEKKRGDSAHKNETAENYYSYADSIGKNLAFIPFTKVYYKMEKPKNGVIVFFDKNNKILVNSKEIAKNDLENHIKNNSSNNDVYYCFDKNMNFGTYVNLKIFVKSIEWKFISNHEFAY
ncbi:hypothetical protein [Flavobacterium sp. A45]|uniref:hypothetical protein n=1 Tax=Flavobacterium sp. A45 TaxID=1945862 RepID=UPI00157C778E|nr:hypothetical protein [Flavobacterium sp. A45]